MTPAPQPAEPYVDENGSVRVVSLVSAREQAEAFDATLCDETTVC